MNCHGLLFCVLFLSAEKLPIPPESAQEPARARIRLRFKAEYARPTQIGLLALADKFIAGAGDEEPATRFVMLSEAILLATKAGDVGQAVRAARMLNRDFEGERTIRDFFGGTLTDLLGPRDLAEQYQSVASGELIKSAARESMYLGMHWQAIGKRMKANLRIVGIRRARQLFVEALELKDLKGLDRAEAEKLCQVATAQVEGYDANEGRFTLYAGKWSVKYENRYVHEYLIGADGSLAFDKITSPDGTVFQKKEDERRARLVRRGRDVLVPFADGKILERLSLDAEKLVVERYDPPSLFPQSNNKGIGVRVK